MEQRDDWRLTELLGHEHGRGDPFAAAVRATRMPMVITDPAQPDNPIVFCNEAFQLLSGYAREEIIGRNCRFLQGPETDPAAIARIRAAVAAGESIDLDILNYRKDGSSFWNALYLSPVRNEEGELRFFFASQMNVSGRIDAQAAIAAQKAQVESEVQARTAELEAALAAKTLLLHEVDHRVKNNLTMIGSLIRLQARTIDDPAVVAKLDAMLERVDALATVHRRLYQADDVTRFDVGALAATLASDTVGAAGRSDIVVRANVEKIEVPSSKAAALGLVLNEVLTNAIKHGFGQDRAGTLTLDVARLDGSLATISIADDGPGMARAGERIGGLGRMLISRLSRQVGATAAWSDAGPGTCVILTFPVEG